MNQAVEVVPWAHPLWLNILEQYHQRRLPHAILLKGREGIGKRLFAMALAHFVLCDSPKDGQACGECRSCRFLRSSNHPDLVEVIPEEKSHIIKVDQIRELLHFMHSTAQQGGYRVVIMNPELMNVNAANALLKSLEEPGKNTLLLLISSQPGQLMATIRSRCQQMSFPNPNRRLASQWLMNKVGVTEEKANELLTLTRESPLLALSFLEHNQLELRTTLMNGMADLLKSRTSVVQLAELLYKNDIMLLLTWIDSLISDVIRLQLMADTKHINNPDRVNMLKAIAAKTNSFKLFYLKDQLLNERKKLLDRSNPNLQLLLETLFLGWIELVRK